MKFTKSEIKQMIKEELEVILTNEEVGEIFGIEAQRQLSEGEGEMAVNQLGRLAEMVDEVRGMIEPSDNLDEWVEAKITKAHDYLSTVLNYLSSDSLNEKSSVMNEDADDDNDMEAEAAHRAGERDGSAGAAAAPPHGFAEKHYMRAYKDAFNRTAGKRAQKSRQNINRRASDLERRKQLRYKN